MASPSHVSGKLFALRLLAVLLGGMVAGILGSMILAPSPVLALAGA